ncbi:uncharacterized protein DUF4183 [Paenibacillus sp. BK033]|uniref:DUF4183 domain-containing protein n=1 Tax=Paenibacillus sp. BK033 TaxID=2512133 RepID=UPI0010CE33CB|nr:DUF4183 domain-containing protein [Paenibacillus sp. BK033]TCM97809.1 uncharacterized protein DUF4183 [Paenibacillus sp. BK033]
MENRYFFSPDTDLDLSLSTAIPANQFTNDDGAVTSEFTGVGPNSFNNLYINGIIQPGGSYDVSYAELYFPPQSSIIFAGTPIVLETVQFMANIIPS